MKMKSYYRYAAAVLAILLVAAVVPSSAEGDEIYFTAANDNLNGLDAATMPFYDKDQYYVHYKIFDDLSLGVYYTYNKENHTLTLFNRRNTLIFQLLLGYSYDNNQQYRESAVSKNNTLYIPINFVCERFGLDLQVIKTPVQVIRVVSDAELSQNEFKDKYYNRIVTEGKEYLGSGEEVSPSPDTTVRPGTSPAPSQEPKIPEVYLTFDCFLTEGIENGHRDELIAGIRDGLKNLLDALKEQNTSATFFLSEDVIDSERDTVLRIVGMGHTIGLLIPETVIVNGNPDNTQSAVEYMNRTNRLLDSYTYTKTNLCRFLVSSLSSDHGNLRDALNGAGYAVWYWTLNADTVTGSTAWQIAQRWVTEIEEYTEDRESVVFRAEVTEDLYRPVINLLGNLNSKDTNYHLITPAKNPNIIR